MVAEILKEYDGSKANVLTSLEQLKSLKSESEGRVKAIQQFVGSLDDFLTDTKSKLCKMVACFDDTENTRRKKLGRVMPAGDVTQESFASLADTFMRECRKLAEAMVSHWKQKGALQVEE